MQSDAKNLAIFHNCTPTKFILQFMKFYANKRNSFYSKILKTLKKIGKI